MSAGQAVWRLIVDSEPRSGPANMAVDEALALSVARAASPPTLRLYAWHPPAVSIGRFQSAQDVDSVALRDRGLDLVRRLSGGRALLHADEVTYAVLLPQSNPLVQTGVLESYRRLSQGLLQALQGLDLAPDPLQPARSGSGPRSAACLEVPSAYEVTMAGQKLVGSAQCRRQGYVLQHGSLPLQGDPALLVSLLAMAEPERVRLRTLLQTRATTLERARAVSHPGAAPLSWTHVAAAMADGFRRGLQLHLDPGSYLPAEMEEAARLIREQYASDDWTYLK